MKKNLLPEAEKDSIDFVTDSMFSLGFLESITKVIFSGDRDRVSVAYFYDQWEGTRTGKIPFSLGAFVGYMYCGFTIVQENWESLIPKLRVSSASDDWGLKNAKIIAAKNKNITINYVIRRIRNSLGHARFYVNFPPEKITRENSMEEVTFTFEDVHFKDSTDTFEAVLTMNDITKVIKKLQGLAHTHVRNKHKRKLPK